MAKKKLSEDDKLHMIGARLKALRLEKGYTSYEKFAWENDINRVQYWRMESGVNVTIKSLLKVLAVYDLSLEDFFKGM